MLSIPNIILQTAPKGHSTPYGTYAAASTANYNLLYRLSGYVQGASRQTYQSNPSYCDYQKTDKKGIYQLDKDQVENQLKSFYNTFNKDDKDITYANKGFKNVVVNFIRIKALCNKCRATFPSKTKLHHHLESGCQEMTSPSLPAKQASSIRIITFKAVH